MLDRLKITCTDRGQHPSVEIARVEWQPSKLAEFEVWAYGDAGDLEPRVSGDGTRQRSRGRGGDVHVRRTPVEMIVRAGGGTTYHLPPCPICRRAPWLRDDKLTRLRRLPPDAACDMSLLPV